MYDVQACIRYVCFVCHDCNGHQLNSIAYQLNKPERKPPFPPPAIHLGCAIA